VAEVVGASTVVLTCCACEALQVTSKFSGSGSPVGASHVTVISGEQDEPGEA
jgi:hypothetical protein